MSVCVYIYIYIYIHTYLNPRRTKPLHLEEPCKPLLAEAMKRLKGRQNVRPLAEFVGISDYGIGMTE